MRITFTGIVFSVVSGCALYFGKSLITTPEIILSEKPQLAPGHTTEIPQEIRSVAGFNPAEMATFRGADEDGDLVVMNGRLLINRSLRRWMDFYLSAVGEKSLEDIVAYMESRMRSIPAPANAEALEILGSYLSYRRDIDDYDEITARKIQGSDLASLNARMEWITQVRRLHFSDDVVAAFFADEEALDRFTLKRMALVQSGASGEELAAADEALPTTLKMKREQSGMAAQLQALRQEAGDDPVLLQTLREEQFGADAAARLALLDQTRQLWHQKLDHYQSLIDAGADEARLTAYRAENFSSAESARLDAALQVRQSQLALK